MSDEARAFPQTPIPDGPSPGLGDLPAMFDEIERSDPIYRPSKFWENLVETHLAELNTDGVEHFKRTVNQKYFQFQFASPFHPLARGLWKRWLMRPRIAPLKADFTNGHELRISDSLIGRLRATSYASYIALLFDCVREGDQSSITEHFEEPLVGDPICVDYRGRRISEDLCNSAAELISVEQAVPEGKLKNARVIELGSGYGRLAWAYLTAFPEIRYVLVDIPPALAVAEQYLVETLPDRKVFGFRQFSDPAEVKDELDDAQVAFLTPNQLEFLPELRADLFINVSSLHEMTPDQIAHYFKLIDRNTSGWFFSKQWISSQNADDDLVINKNDYPVPKSWIELFNRTNALNPDFFEVLYMIGDR